MHGPEDGLSLLSVTVGYGLRPILHEVSIDAKPGEVTGLIGPNGSGKTTVVRVASRGLEPWSGSVTVQGANPYAIPARKAARLVAVVPQDVAPAFEYSALEMVLMGRSPYRSAWGRSHPEDWARARHAMTVANVQHLADRPIGELSGGERQRVTLAQALAQDAPVLLLDEPTTHLDIRHVVEILGTIRDLARVDGATVLAIFHDLNLASAYCDRVYALDVGRVVAAGTPGEVVTRDLLMDVFGVEAEVAPAGSSGRPSVLLAPPVAEPPMVAAGAARAHVIGGAGRGAAMLRSLAEVGLEVTAGVLHAGDTDAAVAERLNLLRVTVPPFSAIDPLSAEDCRALIAGASVLVVCDAPFGPGNVENLRLALEGVRAGTSTVVLDRTPIEERDFTAGEASELWREITRHATVVTSEEEALRRVRREALTSSGGAG